MKIYDMLINRALNGGGGSGGGGDYFVANDVTGTLDKTWQEIHDALERLGIGKVFIYSTYEDSGNTFYGAYVVGSCNHIPEIGYYEVASFRNSPVPQVYYFAENANGYPVLD